MKFKIQDSKFQNPHHALIVESEIVESDLRRTGLRNFALPFGRKEARALDSGSWNLQPEVSNLVMESRIWNLESGIWNLEFTQIHRLEPPQ
jgi:hypothetical protein